MKNLTTQLISLLVLLLLTACEKKPVASFTTDKEIYTVLDTVHLTNTSTNADSYEWTYQSKSVYDNVKSTSTDLTFVIRNMGGFYNSNIQEGEIIVSLTAISKSGKKTSNINKNLPLADVPFKIISFWTANSNRLNTTVFYEGTRDLGTITKLSATKPAEPFVSGATVGINNYPGIYNFTFKNGTDTWTETIVMNREEKQQLYEIK